MSKFKFNRRFLAESGILTEATNEEVVNTQLSKIKAKVPEIKQNINAIAGEDDININKNTRIKDAKEKIKDIEKQAESIDNDFVLETDTHKIAADIKQLIADYEILLHHKVFMNIDQNTLTTINKALNGVKQQINVPNETEINKNKLKKAFEAVKSAYTNIFNEVTDKDDGQGILADFKQNIEDINELSDKVTLLPDAANSTGLGNIKQYGNALTALVDFLSKHTFKYNINRKNITAVTNINTALKNYKTLLIKLFSTEVAKNAINKYAKADEEEAAKTVYDGVLYRSNNTDWNAVWENVGKAGSEYPTADTFWNKYYDAVWEVNKQENKELKIIFNNIYRFFQPELTVLGFNTKLNPFIKVLAILWKRIKNGKIDATNINENTYGALHNAVAKHELSLDILKEFPDEATNTNIIYSNDFYTSVNNHTTLLELQTIVHNSKGNYKCVPGIFFEPNNGESIPETQDEAEYAGNFSTKLNTITQARILINNVLKIKNSDENQHKQEISVNKLADLIKNTWNNASANIRKVYIAYMLKKAGIKKQEEVKEFINSVNRAREAKNKDKINLNVTVDILELAKQEALLDDLIFKQYRLQKVDLADFLKDI